MLKYKGISGEITLTEGKSIKVIILYINALTIIKHVNTNNVINTVNVET